MILIHLDEQAAPAMAADAPAPGTPEFEAQMAPWFAFNQKLIDGGHWIAGAALQPSVTATTLRTAGGRTVTDGPYAETKEQLGGFYLVEAADLDEALALAEAIPAPGGTYEVRPVAFRPDAG
jgi:hypothetical protein